VSGPTAPSPPGGALGAARGVDQTPFEVRLPVLDVGREVKAPSLAEIEALGEEHAGRVPTLRRGLWSRDPEIALRSAAGLTHDDLDATESERVMEVLLPEGQRLGCGVDFDELRSIIGSAELPACMMYLCRARRRAERDNAFGHFHRISRADEIPALLWFGRNEEREALSGWDEIGQPDWHSDRYARERAASETGEDPGAEERAQLLAFLREKLEREADGLWPPEVWMLNVYEPVAEDAELLLALARSLELETGAGAIEQAVALRALGRLRDEASAAYLRARAKNRDDGSEAPHATAALARRGDQEATRRLVEWSRNLPEAMTLLIEVRPRLAVDVLLERLRDPEQAATCLDPLCFASGFEEATFHASWWPEEAFLGIEPALAASPPSPAVLARVVVEVPLCRTRRLARILFDSLSPDRPPPWWQPDVEGNAETWGDLAWNGSPDVIAAFLFSVSPERTRVLLRSWARRPEPELRDWARRALLLVGDPAHAKDLLAWLGRDDRVAILGRSDSPEVRTWLRLRARQAEDPWDRAEAVRVLARLQGWPAHVPLNRPDDEEAPGPDAALILAGRTEEAIRAWPWTRWLADLESDPATAPVRRRLGRRAQAGDRRARAAFWSALRCGRYRWIHYVFENDVHTLNRDPQTYPHWLADMDSNCCRISDGMAYGVFGMPFLEPAGWDQHSLYDVVHGGGIGRPPSQHALALFRLTGGEWVWSPIHDDWWPGLDRATREARIPAPE
jgi:hypothetical protein